MNKTKELECKISKKMYEKKRDEQRALNNSEFLFIWTQLTWTSQISNI